MHHRCYSLPLLAMPALRIALGKLNAGFIANHLQVMLAP